MLAPPQPRAIFTDRSKAVLLLWFTILLIVCVCMYVLVKFIFWIAVWPIVWERNRPFGFLLVVFWLWCRCFKCVLLSLWCLGRKVFGNYIDSWSFPSFLITTLIVHGKFQTLIFNTFWENKFQHFPHTNAWRRIFDLAVERSTYDHGLNTPSRLWVPDALYHDQAFSVLQKNIFKCLTIYGHGGQLNDQTMTIFFLQSNPLLTEGSI